MRYTIEKRNEHTMWYKEGTNILHREDGPAIEWSDGYKAWWVNGKNLTEEEFERYKLIKELAGVK